MYCIKIPQKVGLVKNTQNCVFSTGHIHILV